MPEKTLEKKSLSEHTLLELLKMAGAGIGESAKESANFAINALPQAMLYKLIKGATKENPITTPVKDVGKNVLHGLTMDIAPEVLKGRIKKNLEKVPTMELAETIGNIQQSDEEMQTQKSQDSINPLSASNPSAGLTSAGQPTAVANQPTGNMSAGTESAGTSSADTGNAPAGKKGYGWPIALMMMGRGLQGGNPMDVLAGLMQDKQFNKELEQSNKQFEESTRQFDEQLAFDKEKNETAMATAQTTAEQNSINIKLRNIEAMTAMVNSVKDFSGTFWGGKDANKLMQTIETIYGKTMNQLESGRGTAPESIPTNLVKVINPKGKEVQIEKSQLEGALKSGYKRAK